METVNIWNWGQQTTSNYYWSNKGDSFFSLIGHCIDITQEWQAIAIFPPWFSLFSADSAHICQVNESSVYYGLIAASKDTQIC